MSNLRTSASIPDAAARAAALDITQSFIVEAPAGSGKTGLLIQRFLKLLASPDITDPAQVLAITFTRKATAELVDRVMNALAAAAAATESANTFDLETRPFALAVLDRDRQLDWRLLDNPARLNIRTIDAVSGQIAAALPVLSGVGAGLAPSEDADTLYAEAARRTLLLLGGPDQALDTALRTLLLHRDGNLADAEALIARMIATRDQWGELVPLSRAALGNEQYLDETVLPSLDRALDLAICRTLTRITRIMPPHILTQLNVLAADMGHLAGYKGSASPIAICTGRRIPPQEKSVHLDHWRALIHLILKPSKPRTWRKGFTGNNIGFEILKHQQAELKSIVAQLAEIPGLFDQLCLIASLPPALYPRDQWPITKALFRVLARALAELKVVFAERAQCDFTEVALTARDALRSDSALDDLSAANFCLQHLLVDEMQDTSNSQYDFIHLLTRHWDGHSQTVFLVGDPRQSIYLFRQARVERFVRTLLTQSLGTDENSLPLTALHLTANFRSRPALVEAFNDDFTQIFPKKPGTSDPDQVPYQSAHAIREPSPTAARHWHADPIPYSPNAAVRSAATLEQTLLHADQIRSLIRAHTGKRIAVLVRTRAHLKHIVTALQQYPPIPFRAVDIEPLAARAEILDLLALTRALLHPADRTAWLALLRSPACGLSLADLHLVAGDQDRSGSETTILQLLESRGEDLSPDGIARLQPFWLTLSEALRHRGRIPLITLVARTWQALRFPLTLTPEAKNNTDRFFQLLDNLTAQLPPGTPLSLSRLQARIAKLYAAPSTDPNAVDLMTLHKSKGLEWDIVFVPELHRKGRKNDPELLQYLESVDDTPGILAPISSKGQSTHQLNAWMRQIVATREAAERKRLFYVACTRAREELHLFAAPQSNKEGAPSITADTLLHAAWPAAQPHFEAIPFAEPATAILIPFPSPFPLALAASATPHLIERIPQAPRSHDTTAASFIPQSLRGISGSSDTSGFPQPLSRPEGSFSARAIGNTIHTLLELLTIQFAANHTPDPSQWSPRIAAVLRANGLPPAEIASNTAVVLRALTQTLADPIGRWILSTHPSATAESTLVSPDATIRLDRTFRAGPNPLANGDSHLWIVDYKTATHGSADIEIFLASQRQAYAPQLESYARALAPATIQLALYFPLLQRLIHWPAQDTNPGH